MTELPALDPALRAALRLALAWLLLFSAWHKLRDWPAFRTAFAGYRLLPDAGSTPGAWAVVGAELLLGLGLAWPGSGRTPALAAAGLFALYAAAIATNLLRGRRDLDCGCAGPAARQPLHGGLVTRNLALAGLAGAAALRAGERPLLWVDAVSVVGGACALGLLYVATDLALAGAARLRAVGETP